MTDTLRSDVEAPAETPARRGRRALVASCVVLALILGAAAVLAWAAVGTVTASRVIQQRAGVAQGELGQFRSALRTGDQAASRSHLDAGAAALTDAHHAASRLQVRVMRRVPYAGRTVRDLDHLLSAARTLSKAGGSALDVYATFGGRESKLYAHDTFNVPALRSAAGSVDVLDEALTKADDDLRQVKGDGPRGADALAKKKVALEQVTTLRSQLARYAPLVRAMPAAVGAQGVRGYLVTVLNPAESRASGGAPLSVAFLRLDRGKLTIPLKGQTSVLTNGNAPHVYTAAKGDPWVQGREPRRFAGANLNPDFTWAGEQLARASSSFGQKPDGVIALDIDAISRLLAVTGPIHSPEYGELTAENVAQKLVVDAYLQPKEQAARHERNDELMSTMLGRLTQGGSMVAKAQALGKAVPGRHLQMYFRDADLQTVVLGAHAGGAVAKDPTGDLAAAYTQNTNGSKVDTYQHRTLKETIRLAADGSASVRRTVVIENRTPPFAGLGRDLKTGYDTRWATLNVVNLMSPGSQTTAQPTAANSPGFKVGSAQHKGTDGAGRPYAEALAVLKPGGTAKLVWGYRLAKAAVPDAGGLRLLVRAETQPLLNPPKLEVEVIAPKGWTARAGAGWERTPTGARTSATVDRALLLQLRLVRST